MDFPGFKPKLYKPVITATFAPLHKWELLPVVGESMCGYFVDWLCFEVTYSGDWE